jgi:type I restriction enzyme, S subunit
MNDENHCDWIEVKFGDILAQRKERARSTDPLLSVTNDRGVVPQAESGRRDISSMNKFAYWRVYPGDIVYNTMRMWQGVSARSDYFGIVSPAYTVCSTLPGTDSRFMAHVLRLPQSIAKFKNRSQGLVSDTWNLKYRSFAKLPVVIPGIDEQHEIVAIMDTVDDAIRSTEQFITKLELVKRGLLADLLSRPRHRARLGDYISRGPQNGLYKPASEYYSGGISIVRIDSFDAGELHSLEKLRRLRVTPPEIRRYGLMEDDIIINRVNVVDLVGKCAVVPTLSEPVVFESNIMRLKVDSSKLLPPFLALWLSGREAREHFRRSAKTAIAQASINQTDVRSCIVQVPPLKEQEEILSAVRSAKERITATTSEVRKLRLLKQGLMNDLLTGRVRVGAST